LNRAGAALLAGVALVGLCACSRTAMVDDEKVGPDVEGAARDVRASGLSAADKDAFAAAVALRPTTIVGKTVRRVINEQKSYELGLRLAAQARAADARHRLQMARIIDVGIRAYRDRERSIELTLLVRNKTSKTIRRLDAGLEVNDAAHARIGLAEIRVDRTIAPHATDEIVVPVAYLRFGEDAGSMVLATGKPKTILLDAKEIKFADGTDAGYDD
jgi:hypothetical protein